MSKQRYLPTSTPLWLIGGTINATDIARRLVGAGCQVILSVTTDYGRKLAEETGATVLCESLTEAGMEALIRDRDIRMIIDASHPFAAEVSQTAMQATTKMQVPYLRFERKNIRFEGALYMNSYEDVLHHLEKTEGNIMLTTGSKHITRFLPLGTDRLYARVLSTTQGMEACEKAGIKPEHVIGMKGVFSEELNFALMREFDIRYLVTKDSGEDGGMNEKIAAARRIGAEVLIISRPSIHYPEVFSDYETLIERIKKLL